MRAPHLSTLAAIALTIVAAHASAQSAKPVAGATDSRQVAIGYASLVDSRADAAARATELANRLTARIADADSLFTAGNFDAARRAFKDVTLTLFSSPIRIIVK